ncbi:ligand-gated ion channel [Mangrovibacterium diazotrophicum]|uniref:Neurotransmitter-gated ion-channel n=1 Tax=Mangrovibacterium diazotrophicum TaxID=1261403 RepID=A0A419W3I2_9BACT|nr:hypothetical protein [Mangrovibacterium diazotrophicum]RKD89860.1 neurotransmitter-gated ion-channel [Mangrovibacterium diazotrophicum]
MKKGLKASFLIISVFMTLNCFSNDENQAINLDVGLHINDFSINSSDAIFYVNFYWWCKIPLSVPDSLISEYSTLEFINARPDAEIVIGDTRKTIFYYIVSGTCKGEFNYTPNFRDYPKDRQVIPIIIESANLPEDLLVLNPDTLSYANSAFQGFDDRITLDEYKLASSKFNKSTKIYKTTFGDPDYSLSANYSRLNYEVTVKRNSRSYLLKIIIPCVLLSLIAYLVFYIPANKLDVAVGCTVTALLACIAVQLSTVGDIPNIGYITKSDLIFYLFYTMICLALIQTVYTYRLEKNEKIKLANILEYSGRVLYPIAIVIGLILIL